MHLTLPLLLLAANVGKQDAGYLGVLEEYQPAPYKRLTIARVLFRATQGGWVALPDGFKDNHPLQFDPSEYESSEQASLDSLPQQMRWQVCFDGKTLGKVASLKPTRWRALALRGSLFLFEERMPPWVGKEGFDFSGWPEKPVHRPLVLNSEARCDDPSRWKPTTLPHKIAQGLGEKFASIVGESIACELDAGATTCAMKVDRWDVRRAYRDRGSRWLLEVRALESSGNVQPFLFFVDGKDVHLLGMDMRVLDAGDYDGDGQSEVVVRFQRYNHDGYTLFFGPRLERSASFGWRYH